VVTLQETTDRRRPVLVPAENDLSRRYLRMIERWIPHGVEYFATWPERPNCGHFFGGVHWYGQETADPALTLALVSTSSEYDPRIAGVSKDDLRRMAIQAVRYLCFTHDTGPADCVRPAIGLGRPENCGTKWGERGRGFFRESQCGHTTANLALICLLLGEEVDEETWMMVARIQEDYLERFGDMPPKSGVYWDTQMEENAWTSHGLAGALLFLERHPRAAEWEAMARRWMFSTCATPQDAKDWGSVGELTARVLSAKTFTTLPDYWAENHGMVHPTYTASGIRTLMTVGSLLRLWGRELPPELYWNRRRIYENFKPLTDGGGYPQAVQGMDWHYLPAVGNEVPHAIGSVFFQDPVAAALQRRALHFAELRQLGNGGRMYSADIALKAHDQQDPMVMREITSAQLGVLYLLHRLFGPGAEPVPEPELELRLQGVRHFPHAGFVHHRHPNGQTSFSWRNSIMVLPLPRDGIYVVAPASDSFLGTPKVADRPDSHRQQSVRVAEYGSGFAAALVMNRCQESLRQEVLFASLPDGRALSFERFVALEEVVLEGIDQGFLRITNEHFPRLGAAGRGVRTLYTPYRAKDYRGWIGESEADDIVDQYDDLPWLNVDDRLGIRFTSTGSTVYHNRHFFRPYRAVADDLTLSMVKGPKRLVAGDSAASLAALLCPEQAHTETASTRLEVAESVAAVCLVTDGYAAAANFSQSRRQCTFALSQPKTVPIFRGGTVENRDGQVQLTTCLEAGEPILLEAVQEMEVDGDVRIDATPADSIYVTNIGERSVHFSIVGVSGEARELAPGVTLLLTQ
jgi:hypothetical protein